jgi:hypothetical protein
MLDLVMPNSTWRLCRTGWVVGPVYDRTTASRPRKSLRTRYAANLKDSLLATNLFTQEGDTTLKR